MRMADSGGRKRSGVALGATPFEGDTGLGAALIAVEEALRCASRRNEMRALWGRCVRSVLPTAARTGAGAARAGACAGGAGGAAASATCAGARGAAARGAVVAGGVAAVGAGGAVVGAGAATGASAAAGGAGAGVGVRPVARRRAIVA